MEELQTMIGAIEKAQRAGVYTLQEVSQILQAIGAVSNKMQECQKCEPKQERPKTTSTAGKK